MAGFLKEFFWDSRTDKEELSEYVDDKIISLDVAKELKAAQKRAASIKVISHRKKIENPKIKENKNREENVNAGRQQEHDERTM